MATDHPRQRQNISDVNTAYDHFRNLSDRSLPRSHSRLVNIALRCAVKVRF